MMPPTSRSILPRLFALVLLLASCSPDTVSGPDARTTAISAIPERNPILFVHGWNSSGAAWFSTIERFKSDGWSESDLVNWTYYSGQSNVKTAEELSARVDSILLLTGKTKVDLVTHSMGALSARYYIKNLGGLAKVDEFISLGGPNHGTNSAFFCAQISCIEMRPNSSFLTALNRKDETPGTVIRYGTWWSPCDEVISPQRSTILSGATNTQTTCLRHSDLRENATVYQQIKTWVQ